MINTFVLFIIGGLLTFGQTFAQPIAAALIRDSFNDDELYLYYLNGSKTFSKSELNKRYVELNSEIRKDKLNPSLYYERAVVKRNANLRQQALDDFEKAFQLAKEENLSQEIVDSIDLERCLSRTTPTQSQLEPCFDYFINKQPLNDRAIFFRGLFYYCFAVASIEERIANANKMFKWYLDMHPNDKDASLLTGMGHYRLKNYTEASEIYDKVITLNPSFGAAYTQRGKLYEKLGTMTEACSDFIKAIQLGEKEAIHFQEKYCK